MEEIRYYKSKLETEVKKKEKKVVEYFKSKENIIYISAILAIVIIAIYFRMPLTKYQGFFEPDGFYHYSVIRAAINNNYIIPKYLDISGWPAHTPVSEPNGLYWVTLLPYLLLHGISGISAYTIMRLVPVLFGLFDIFGAYYLARYLSKSRLFGLLVMLFVALSLGDAARTSALIYRGDSFVTVFLIISLFLFIKVLKEENLKKGITYAVLSGFFLSVCNYVWNGAPFATATYIFAFIVVVLFSFSFNNKQMLKRSGFLVIGIIVWFILVNIYKAMLAISEQTFTGIHFTLLIALMAFGWYLAYYILSNMSKYYKITGTLQRRATFAVAILAISFIIIYTIMPGFVYEIFVGNGFTVTNYNSFAGTIEELQPPSQSYLFASFGVFLFTTPMSLVIYLSTAALHKLLFWIILLFCFVPYFFMQIENDNNMHTAKAYLKFKINEAMLVIISYYAITAYLQIHAVRFNSLISIPLAILSAYTIYWIIVYAKGFKKSLMYAGYGVIISIILYTVIIDYSYSLNLVQADGINSLFLQAMSWAKNNTPTNSVFLALWPDGSVIEGWANRTSVTDSVGSQNVTKADAFALWLYNSSPDGSFLLSNINGKPNYLVARYGWLLETNGIFIESGINPELAKYYGYELFTSLKEINSNTTNIFEFTNSQTGMRENTEIVNDNKTQQISSYLIYPNGTAARVGYVAFENIYNLSFVILKQMPFNETNGGLMLIIYSTIPNPTERINVTGAFFFAPGITNSNMLKFLYFCNNKECLWNNNVASLDLVYSNPDTRIYKIIYNSTN
ncbi:MAG: hypothetical protein ACP5RT_01110 [Candidatus Micrarchaeia archaeon]